MQHNRPDFSICIPTYNRADLLEFCLERLRDFERFGKPFEIVVSDNASSDRTAEMIAARQTSMPYLRLCRQTTNVGSLPNWMNAIRNAQGAVVIYVADDDSVIASQAVEYVKRFEREPDLSAIYADVIAYDDDAEREMHRYYHFRQPISFAPEDPLGLVNFVFQNLIYPEVGIFRRSAFTEAYTFAKRSLPFHFWMYRLSRAGRVAFELQPYYRENRVLKKRFGRVHWLNMDWEFHYIGDELRLSLENMLLSALQDAGMSMVPDDQQFSIRKMIERYLHGRTTLGIQRAAHKKNWLLAWELRRRLVLWYGPGGQEEQFRDFQQITFPAALQSVQETLACTTGVQGLRLRGFQGQQIPEFFRVQFPEVRILTGNSGTSSDASDALVLCNTAADMQALLDQGVSIGRLMCFEHLLDQFRVNKNRVDLRGI